MLGGERGRGGAHEFMLACKPAPPPNPCLHRGRLYCHGMFVQGLALLPWHVMFPQG